MTSLSCHRHRFPIDVIQQAVWLYFQFPLSLRNVEDLLAQRGIDVSYETVRRWSVKFGLGCVSRVSPVQTVMRNCTRDGGRPSGFGDQELIPSYRKLLWSKAMVVSVAEKSRR